MGVSDTMSHQEKNIRVFSHNVSFHIKCRIPNGALVDTVMLRRFIWQDQYRLYYIVMTSWRCWKLMKLTSNISKMSPTLSASNIRHQHRIVLMSSIVLLIGENGSILNFMMTTHNNIWFGHVFLTSVFEEIEIDTWHNAKS